MGVNHPVDVIITTMGGLQTTRAIDAGGGLVGIRSSASLPYNDAGKLAAPINFVDWPFKVGEADETRHFRMVRQTQPTYAVAPDVEEGRALEDVIDQADILARHAEQVIVVPKEAMVRDVPERFLVGMPVRAAKGREIDMAELREDLGVNGPRDFQGRPLHLLGGNPTFHFELQQRFDLTVNSIDSPFPLKWADSGRVWIARLGGANEVNDLDPAVVGEIEAATAFDFPTHDQMRENRFHRIKFTVQNLRQAWEEGVVTVDRAVAPGRGPPPPAPEGLHGEGREEVAERFEEATEEEELGEIEDHEREVSLEEALELAVEESASASDPSAETEPPAEVAGWELVEDVGGESGRVIWAADEGADISGRPGRHTPIELRAVARSDGWGLRWSWETDRPDILGGSTDLKTRPITRVDDRAEAIDRAVEEMEASPAT